MSAICKLQHMKDVAKVIVHHCIFTPECRISINKQGNGCPGAFHPNQTAFTPREGVIIEWPLNGLFHDRRDVIIMSQMVIIRFPFNNGRSLKCRNFVYIVMDNHAFPWCTLEILIPEQSGIQMVKTSLV